jgi:dipeptidase E
MLRGPRAALIANAIDNAAPENRMVATEQEMERLRAIGLEPQEIDLRQYFGRSEDLARRLRAFDLIWVHGGNVFILRRAFRESGADAAIKELLAEDRIAYGGYSAGGCILSPSLRGVELVDDPADVPPSYPSDVIWDALGVLPFAFVPHFRSDHPESSRIERVVEHYIQTHVPFIALRDGEAIVVADGETRVVG